MRTTSEREVQNYDCPRLGKPVVFSYLFEDASVGHGAPRGVHCAGALECGVERILGDETHGFNWRLCPLWPVLVDKGFLPR